MALINVGNQNVTFNFEERATSVNFNQILDQIKKAGVYSGGKTAITTVETITMQPFKAVIPSVFNDGSITHNLSIAVETRAAIVFGINNAAGATLDLGTFNASGDYIIYTTYTYEQTETNFLDFGIRLKSSAKVEREVALCGITITTGEITAVTLTDRLYGDDQGSSYADENRNTLRLKRTDSSESAGAPDSLLYGQVATDGDRVYVGDEEDNARSLPLAHSNEHLTIDESGVVESTDFKAGADASLKESADTLTGYKDIVDHGILTGGSVRYILEGEITTADSTVVPKISIGSTTAYTINGHKLELSAEILDFPINNSDMIEQGTYTIVIRQVFTDGVRSVEFAVLKENFIYTEENSVVLSYFSVGSDFSKDVKVKLDGNGNTVAVDGADGNAYTEFSTISNLSESFFGANTFGIGVPRITTLPNIISHFPIKGMIAINVPFANKTLAQLKQFLLGEIDANNVAIDSPTALSHPLGGSYTAAQLAGLEDARKLHILVKGGGGSGGTSAGSSGSFNSPGTGGGGAGFEHSKLIDITDSDVFALMIGAGGIAPDGTDARATRRQGKVGGRGGTTILKMNDTGVLSVTGGHGGGRSAFVTTDTTQYENGVGGLGDPSGTTGNITTISGSGIAGTGGRGLLSTGIGKGGDGMGGGSNRAGLQGRPGFAGGVLFTW